MTPNIFNFSCVDCEYNRRCYCGSNYQHCIKSAELLRKVKEFFEKKETEVENNECREVG